MSYVYDVEMICHVTATVTVEADDESDVADLAAESGVEMGDLNEIEDWQIRKVTRVSEIA